MQILERKKRQLGSKGGKVLKWWWVCFYLDRILKIRKENKRKEKEAQFFLNFLFLIIVQEGFPFFIFMFALVID